MIAQEQHYLGKQARTPRCRCLNCNERIDAASGVDHDRKPNPGDVSLCIYCGHIAVYADDLTLRPPTDAEAHMLAGDKAVLAASKAIAKLKAERD